MNDWCPRRLDNIHYLVSSTSDLWEKGSIVGDHWTILSFLQETRIYFCSGAKDTGDNNFFHEFYRIFTRLSLMVAPCTPDDHICNNVNFITTRQRSCVEAMFLVLCVYLCLSVCSHMQGLCNKKTFQSKAKFLLADSSIGYYKLCS